MNGEYFYDEDDTHPIPSLRMVDINTVKKSGGSDLFIVVAEPLSGDRRSLERLLRKLELYLEFIATEEFRRQSGPANAANTNIIVKIHRDSDSRAFELLERNRQWISNNNATLVVDTDL